MYMDTDSINRARKTDMIDFLAKHNGFTFKTHQGSYRCDQHPSLAIKENRLSWYWHSKSVGGYGVFDYLINIEDMNFKDALEIVEGSEVVTAVPSQHEKPPKNLCLPEKKWIPVQLHKYLCIKRGIASTIINTLLDEGKIYEDKNGNIVFVAFDENNIPKFASVRGTHTVRGMRWDCAGSDKSYGFNMTYSETKKLYIFESPIDAMSHATIQFIDDGLMESWKTQNRLSLAGTSDIAIPRYLKMHPYIEELAFCLDNDEPGIEAADKLIKKYADKGFTTKHLLPIGKDYNEELMTRVTQLKAEKSRSSKKDDLCL